MRQLLIGTNIPFMRYRRIAYAFSGTLILATTVWLFVHGGPRYSVDFTGGTLLQIRTSQVLPADQVRQALDAGGFRGIELQQMAGQNRDEFLLRLQQHAGQDPFVGISQAIQAKFPGVQVERRRTETVGPRIGSELRTKAIWAVLGSLAGILLYVGIRYEFKFAFGAVVALFHDVFITLGMLCFTGREVSLTVVAALLTIAGYSINDTIVVFDRIRERSRALRKETHSRAMDIAVNRLPEVVRRLRDADAFDAEGAVEPIPISSNDEIGQVARAFDAVHRQANKCDVCILCAAVADYKPAKVSPVKIKKRSENFSLELIRTRDILDSLGHQRDRRFLLVGFAAETNHVKENAAKKLHDKNCDIIVANDVSSANSGIESDANEVTILFQNGAPQKISRAPKKIIASELVKIFSKIRNKNV